VRNVLRAAGFSVIFSAPASYLALPVERVFSLIKKEDLEDNRTPNLPIVKDKGIKKLTNKQRTMLKVSEYINNLSELTIK
jgi:hypothetical protein